MLKGNDRLLARVESLAGELEVQDDHGEDAIMERTKKLAAKLAEFRAEEIRCRLDRIFLENAPNEFKMGQQHKDYDTELTGQSFEQQLSSLYPEISVVAKGSIDQNFVEPVMEQLSQGRERRKAQSGAVLCYVRTHLPLGDMMLLTWTDYLCIG